MNKHRVKQFERLSSQAADIDELVGIYKRALYKLGFRRPARIPKNRWDTAQWLFRHFHDSFLRLQQKSGENPASPATAGSLSGREREILRWSAAGLTRLEIASALCISYHTVDFHMRGILRKLDAANMLLAVSKAQHLGLIAFQPQRGNAKLKARRERAEKYRRAKIHLAKKRRREAARKAARRR
jgi:DNA-binding CsgD family transcriptional regulator